MPGRTYWPLPTTVNPPDRLCAIVQVPNDPQHVAAFMGALYDLAKWYSWERDEAHTGKDVAAVWWEIYQHISLGDCRAEANDTMNFRQRGCVLEYSIDCETWYTLYDPTDCITGLTGQPSGEGVLAPGECKSFDVTLRGNDRWLLPVPVSEDYTVTVTLASGGWYDGGEVAWRCPDGAGYVLGTCAGATTTLGGDPIPASPHMCLVGSIDTGTPLWFEALAGVYTVPSGVTDNLLTFQANDSDISDNSGSIVFHVSVCNTGVVAGWEHIFDFTLANQGFSVTGGFQGQYVAGTGWQTEYLSGGGGQEQFVIEKIVSTPQPITEYIAEINMPIAPDVGTGMSFWTGAGFVTLIDNLTVNLTGLNSYDKPVSGTLTSKITLVLNGYHYASHHAITLARLTVRGTGSDPF